MCGFNSIFHYNGRGTVDVAELRATRDHMTARGPDGHGEWLSADGRVGLGHRRLSIIDLSDRGAQPMHSVDGRYSISFNGEIYNYRPLREQCLREGWSFHSESDTEVLMALYARHGEAMLRMIRGMFAFALWDHERSTLFAARDPYGIKPLYYADDGNCIRLASQVKALLAGGAVSAEMDDAALCGFLLLGSVPEPRSIIRAVRALPAGHWLRVDAHGITGPVRYESIADILHCTALQQEGDADATERIRAALRDTVAHHMIADVPVGAFLSAGIDSGTLLGLARDAGVEDIRTVTLAFEEFRGRHDDEAPLAEMVAKHYATDHRTRMLTAEEFSADLEHILEVMDQPSIDGINTYYVSKAARENGLKVALSGLGGDELFAGYNTFVDVPAWVRKFRVPSRVPFAGELFRRGFSLLPGSAARSPKAAGALLYGGNWAGAWYLRRGLFMPWELPALLGRERAEAGLRELQLFETIAEAMTPEPATAYGRVAALEAGLYMRNQLLRDSDWAGMAHSIEIRVPLVDIALLRTLAPVLHTVAPRERKRVLAASPSRPIPAQLLERAKTGFQVPIRHWLESDERIDVWKRVPALRAANWERRWAYVLALRGV